MWTNTSLPQKNGFIKKKKLEWFPNHFVPLVSVESPVVKANHEACNTKHNPTSTEKAQEYDSKPIPFSTIQEEHKTPELLELHENTYIDANGFSFV